MTAPSQQRLTDIEVISGVEGACLSIGNTRVCGPKPWGGGTVTASWTVDADVVLAALPTAAETLRLRADLAEARTEIARVRSGMNATPVVRRAIDKLLTETRARAMTEEENGALNALRQLEIDVAAFVRALEPPR